MTATTERVKMKGAKLAEALGSMGTEKRRKP